MRAAAGLIAGIILGSLVEVSVTGGATEILAIMLLELKDGICIPAYTGEFRQVYSRIAEEREL